MPELTLAAKTYWDQLGRVAGHDLDLTLEGPPLAAADPGRVFVVGHAADGRFVMVQVDRRTLPPELSGPERDDYEPGRAYERGEHVWVWSALCRDWCPGTVDAASKLALQVTYARVGQRGTVADAVPPCYVARRSTADQVNPETSPAG